MLRPRILIIGICIVIIVVGVWMRFSWQWNRGSTSTKGGYGSIKTPDTASPSNGAVIKALAAQRLAAIQSDRAWDWKRPIAFYGIVLDASSAPVPQAIAKFQWANEKGDGQTAECTANNDGRFELKGVHGKVLQVQVEKAGYYPFRRGVRFSFEYADPEAPQFHVPEANRPVAFRLLARGVAEPLVVVKQSARVARNGDPTYISLAGENPRPGQNQLKVQCWTSEKTNVLVKRYEWRCQLSVPEGGIIETTNEFPFVAPDVGYRPNVEIHMPIEPREQWSSDVTKSYFVKLPNALYGRISFRMIAGGDHFCRIESFINLSGSNNLEFDPSVQPKVPIN